MSLFPERYAWRGVSRYKITKDSLEVFNQHYISTEIFQPNDFHTTVSDFNTRLSKSADACFGPLSAPSGNTKKRTPWWNEVCQAAIKSRRRAFRLFQRRPTMENLRVYQSLSSTAKDIVKRSKKDSFHEYISGLNHTIPQSQIWKKLKAFKSSYTPQSFPLENNNRPLL